MEQVDGVLRSGQIDPRVKQYWLFMTVFVSIATLVGVPFLPFTLLIACCSSMLRRKHSLRSH